MLGAPALALDHASLVLVDTPVPSPSSQVPTADGNFRPSGVLATCGVTWTVPVEGSPSATVEADCPAEHRAAVEAAAARWSFGAVDPLKGQSTVTVRRWMALEAEGSELRWSARTAPPALGEEPEGCVKAVARVTPSFPSNFVGDYEDCSVWMRLDERGRPVQLEVDSCANAAAFYVLDAAEDWRFKVCEDLAPELRNFRLNVQFKMP